MEGGAAIAYLRADALAKKKARQEKPAQLNDRPSIFPVAFASLMLMPSGAWAATDSEPILAAGSLVRRGAVKSNRIIFCVGINEAEDAVAVGRVGADGCPIGGAQICSRLNQARLVGATVASNLEAAAGQNTTDE